jgi:hypothetical protein
MKATVKYDRPLPGLIAGIVLPAIAFLVSWLVLSDNSIGEYFRQFQMLNRLSGIISLSALPNLLIFFIFIWLNMYRAARGVITATFILAFAMLIVKFI